MAKKKIKKLDALIFIDTNILLDFYRIRKTKVSLKYLKIIEEHKEKLIVTSQVEMEYKKNRQSAILESITEVKNNNFNLSVPAILSDSEAVKMIKKHKKKIDINQKKLKEKTEKILKSPSLNDKVFQKLQKVFKYKCNYNLNRENKQRFTIRGLACKRFRLGYPPRKNSGNSIGDAVNWEWIIKCAETSKKNIIIVTRDTDFGVIYENESYLNDWLKQEFKERISQRRKLILTDKLSTAFEYLKADVTKEMIEEEEKVIKLSNHLYIKKIRNTMLKKLRETEIEEDNDLEQLE